jgi:hypothetical protein
VKRHPVLLHAVWASGLLACGEVPLDAVRLPEEDVAEGLADGLVAHFRLDDVEGTVALDSSAGERHGELSGGSWILDGRFAGALRLSSGDSVRVEGFPHASPNFTVATWIRMTSEQLAMNSEQWVSILSMEDFATGGWQLNIDNRLPRSRFDFAYWAPPLSGYLFVGCECVDVGRWVHLAAVVDTEANRVTLYEDGVVGDQETRPSDVPPGDSTLYFGRWNMDGRFLSGDLDDVAIWSRALTASEIAALQAESPTVGDAE